MIWQPIWGGTAVCEDKYRNFLKYNYIYIQYLSKVRSKIIFQRNEHFIKDQNTVQTFIMSQNIFIFKINSVLLNFSVYHSEI